jgi:hypothetical protein
MFYRLWVWLYFKLNPPVVDVTDDELPAEARATWENLEDAYEDED